MKHLFIINPCVDKIRGKTGSVVREIEAFCENDRLIEYDIHVTRWARDAVGFIRRYASSARDLVRVHVLGGSGTLFEAVNGIIGLPNAQLAAYPMGGSNYFLRYFGDDKIHLFASMRNQIFSGVTAIDAIRCGSNYGIAHGLVGIEAVSGRDGVEMIEKYRLPTDFCYLWSVSKNLIAQKNVSQDYKVLLDGRQLDGRYITMMIANGPCYGRKMYPAVDAHPNDGLLDVYIIKDMSRRRRLTTVPRYAFGNYGKIPDVIAHYVGSKLEISSESVICLAIDGETFYDNSVEYEVIPYAIDFVCPAGIDIGKIPRVRNRPEEGFADER